MGPFAESFQQDHLLSRVDVRIKLLVTLILLGMVISYQGFFLPGLVLSISFVMSLLIKIPLRVFLLRFAEPALVSLILLVLKCFFSGKDPFFSIAWGGLTLSAYRDGLIEGLRIVSRIQAAVSIVALLGFSTTFIELLSGLSWLRVPKGLIEIAIFAYRYLFVLSEEAMVIYQSQKIRLGYSTLFRGIGSFVTLWGSLVLKAFEQSERITATMVQRGYDGHIPWRKETSIHPTEVVLSAFLVLGIGLVWAIG